MQRPVDELYFLEDHPVGASEAKDSHKSERKG
jgi:hypothetical protein